ncbi:putative disease resistance protein RGA3 [Musa acuminata AAA Group]|uniref:putative disease resistance protein RGA3 n=1 Tax=Musa acuminata AAA Group TaxID=214697 RepID=UPI0031DD527C
MAMFLEFFVSRYLGKLAEFVEGEACKVLGAKKEIKKLQRRLARIQPYLEDAEKKRHENEAIKGWVMDMKDLMYDADDVIDLCMFEGGKLLEARTSASSSGVCLPFHLLSSCFTCIRYRHQVSSRIKELNDKFREITEDSLIISTLVKSDQGSSSQSQDNMLRSRETHSLEVKSDIVGTQIEDATQNLINKIMQNDKSKCQIFGIVGMGGIGKTTLARKIFNDERIKTKFPKRIWLYVSKNYAENDLLSKIIRSAGGSVEGGESKEQLVEQLVSLISQDFFVVLDDVWGTDVWEKLLRDPMMSGVASSRIVVTSRYEDVVKRIGNKHIHHVDRMDNESGWALLCKIVFREEEDHEIGRLKEIGKKIVEKCDGLPLAIKAVGGVLRSKETSQAEWKKVCESDWWHMKQMEEEVPRALYLSYEDLPYHLKLCFLYCALYPLDNSQPLALLWVAEGFIAEQGERLMEDIALDYYMELIQRNLLQLDPYSADQVTYVMHDLLRSLGKSLVQGESICMIDDETLKMNPLMKIRRLSMSNMGEILTLPGEVMRQSDCLRTLLLFDSYQTKTVEDDVLKRLRHLRVLDLAYTSIETIPDTIGKLIHLRYLRLARTKIHEIPETIGRLANLQMLLVQGCQQLHVLPKAIIRLHNLRCLALSDTPLTHMPKGIGRLKNLTSITGFVVGHDESRSKPDEEWCDLEELQSLSKMRHLSIYQLQRATINGVSVLTSMSMLRELTLGWTMYVDPCSSEDQIQRAEKIFDQLSPPSSLQKLSIEGFPGRRFPSWMTPKTTPMGDSLPNLKFLSIRNLPSCVELPPVSRFPQLKWFYVKRAKAIKTIGPEFLGLGEAGGEPTCRKLEHLKFKDMPNWEEWEEEKVDGDDGGRALRLRPLPNLKSCRLEYCPKLRALPDVLRHAPNLEILAIRNNHFMREIDDLPFLADKLIVVQMEMLQRISNLPSVEGLHILHCPRLESVENLNILQHLCLLCPPETEHLPKWLPELIEQHRSAPSARRSFKKFELYCGLPLLSSCLKGEPNWHIIQQIPEVRVQTYDKRNFLYAKDHDIYETNVGSE